MNKQGLFSLLLVSVFMSSGCLVRTYQVTKERVDQDLNAGNRGYLMGQVPAKEMPQERKTTRSNRVVEVELRPLIKFEKKSRPKAPAGLPQSGIEQGITTGSKSLPSQDFVESRVFEDGVSTTSVELLEEYTVQKNDTLQKISQKFYGTTKKWMKIYNANKDTMKGPNKIYPGQVINIPKSLSESPSETAAVKNMEENLK
ncbi:MAG: LysM peptidoglycan-binding domain-containing protein [Candidatus Omnitrophota bacterium]